MRTCGSSCTDIGHLYWASAQATEIQSASRPMGREALSWFHPTSATDAQRINGCAAALLAVTGLPGAVYLESAFNGPLAGGLCRSGCEEGFQSMTLFPWRARSGYSSRSTLLLYRSVSIISGYCRVVNWPIALSNLHIVRLVVIISTSFQPQVTGRLYVKRNGYG